MKQKPQKVSAFNILRGEGILCFERVILYAQSMGMKTEFFRNAPSDCSPEYIASFKIY